MRPGKRRKLEPGSDEAVAEKEKASVRAKVKRIFDCGKVRYRGLAKNTQRLALLLGLCNLMTAEGPLAGLRGGRQAQTRHQGRFRPQRSRRRRNQRPLTLTNRARRRVISSNPGPLNPRPPDLVLFRGFLKMLAPQVWPAFQATRVACKMRGRLSATKSAKTLAASEGKVGELLGGGSQGPGSLGCWHSYPSPGSVSGRGVFPLRTPQHAWGRVTTLLAGRVNNVRGGTGPVLGELTCWPTAWGNGGCIARTAPSCRGNRVRGGGVGNGRTKS